MQDRRCPGAIPEGNWLPRRGYPATEDGGVGEQRPPSPPRLRKHYRLEARNLEPFPAALVLALDEIVAAQHVGSGFLKTRAVVLVGATPQRFLFRPLDPPHIIGFRLAAVKTGKSGRFLGFLLVEEVTLVHGFIFYPKTRSVG